MEAWIPPIIMGTFLVGMKIGVWLADGYWLGKANGYIRAAKRGRFFWVIEDTQNTEKLRESLTAIAYVAGIEEIKPPRTNDG